MTPKEIAEKALELRNLAELDDAIWGEDRIEFSVYATKNIAELSRAYLKLLRVCEVLEEALTNLAHEDYDSDLFGGKRYYAMKKLSEAKKIEGKA